MLWNNAPEFYHYAPIMYTLCSMSSTPTVKYVELESDELSILQHTTLQIVHLMNQLQMTSGVKGPCQPIRVLVKQLHGN